MALNYPHNIPSIAQMHPDLENNANVLGVQALHGVTASNEIGTPIDPEAVINADSTVSVLVGVRGNLPGVITDPVLETARNRASILRDTHARLEFGIQPFPMPQLDNMQQQLNHIQQQQNHMQQQLARMEASTANSQISSQNRRTHAMAVARPLRPFQKWIPGDGHALATPIAERGVLPGYAQNFHPNANVGDLPPDDWDWLIHAYTLREILKLVIFYNYDFGIHHADSAAEKGDKICAWLCDQ